MINIALDTEDRSAVIEYLHSRNACLIEDDGTICCNPQCPTREHLVVFKSSNVFSYHDAINGLNAYLGATELWNTNRKLDPLFSHYTYDESDVILFSGGWPIKNTNRYMHGSISFRLRRMDGTQKPVWLQEEYNLLVRFIKKRTKKHSIVRGVNIYLSPSIDEKWQQGELKIFNLSKDY